MKAMTIHEFGGPEVMRLEEGDKIAAAASILEDQEVTEEKK